MAVKTSETSITVVWMNKWSTEISVHVNPLEVCEYFLTKVRKETFEKFAAETLPKIQAHWDQHEEEYVEEEDAEDEE